MNIKSILHLTALIALFSKAAWAEQTLLNVSYDPTREFYAEYNALFARYWKTQKNTDIKVQQSHGGSGKQARSVIDGIKADVVTLALAYDIDTLTEQGLVKPNWQKKLQHNAAPYRSTIVFLVRKSNPKKIRDWPDLIRGDVKVITPNPKTSGGARWNYLAAWAWASAQPNATDASAKQYVAKLLANVPILETGARGATLAFTNRGVGDVLLAWENEALLITQHVAPGQFEIVLPSLSITAEPPVAIVDKVVDKRGTRDIAEAYLKYLYSPAGQTLAAKHFFRPSDETVTAKFATVFPQVKQVTVDQAFGGWKLAQKTHFEDGGTFDVALQSAQKLAAKP